MKTRCFQSPPADHICKLKRILHLAESRSFLTGCRSSFPLILEGASCFSAFPPPTPNCTTWKHRAPYLPSTREAMQLLLHSVRRWPGKPETSLRGVHGVLPCGLKKTLKENPSFVSFPTRAEQGHALCGPMSPGPICRGCCKKLHKLGG